MKLKTNLFQGKKPCLEEGQMIYTVCDNDNPVVAERSWIYRFCRQFIRIIFYALLFGFILSFVWVLFEFASRAVGSANDRPMCGTGLFHDYFEAYRGVSNPIKIDDTDEAFYVMNYVKDLMEDDTSANMDVFEKEMDTSTVTYEEAKKYMKWMLQRQDDATRVLTSRVLEA